MCVCVPACVFVCVFVYDASVHVSAKRVESLLDPLAERVREVKARQTSLGSARTQVKRLTSAIDTWRRHIEQGKPAVYPHDMRKFFGSEGSKYFRELMARDSMRSTEHTPEHVTPSVPYTSSLRPHTLVAEALSRERLADKQDRRSRGKRCTNRPITLFLPTQTFSLLVHF